MGLISCPECKEKVSDSASSCPKCGYQLTPEKIAEIKEQQQRIQKVVGGGCGLIAAGIVVLIILVAVFGGKSNLSKPDKIDAFVMSKQFVKERLKSPASADFPSYEEQFVADEGNGRFRVYAYVDAQNSFGAKIRTQYVCVLSSKDGDSWKLEDVTFLQ